MEDYLKSKTELKRRDVLVGTSLLLGAGAMVGFFGGKALEPARQEQVPQDSPLKPEDGEAQSSLVIEWLPDTVKRWKPQIEKYSNEYEVDPNLLAIMMTIESGGDPHADSGAAKGLMQVTDKTAEDIAAMYLKNTVTKFDITDPETNIEFGAAYVRYLINRFGNADQGPSWDETVTLVAASYNGGPDGGGKTYRDNKWAGLEAYDRQTLNYARYVRVMWQERHDPRSFTYYYWREIAKGQALIDNAEKYHLP